MDRHDVATSPQLLRRMNTAAVLRYALDAGTFQAADVMAATGLTRATVLGLCAELVAQGWIEEADDARSAGQYSKGRPARRYRLRESAGRLVAVDAGAHRLTAVVADLRGTVLGRGEQRLTGSQAPRREAAIRAIVDSALAAAGAEPGAVFLSVVGVPAPVDALGRSPDDNGFWQLVNPGFGDALAGCGEVLVDNDANLAALAEGKGSGPGESFAALLSGERLGTGIVLDGRLVRGHRGGAGELRLLQHVDGVGSAVGLGRLAREWAAELRRTGALAADSALAHGELSAPRVLRAAQQGDDDARRIARRLGDRLARIAEVLASLLDVERIILAGAVAASAQQVIARAEEVLARNGQQPVPRLEASTLGADVVVLGALECALDSLRRDPLRFTPSAVADR